MNHILQTGTWPSAMQAEIDSQIQTLREPIDAIQAILTRSNTKTEVELLETLPNLKVIATCGVGYDGIPLDYCKQNGIVVSNTPGVLNDAVCELTIGLLLGLMRQLPAADRFTREGRWEQGLFPLTRSLAGKRVGIVGMGRIGQDLAARLLPFKVQLAYSGPSRKNLPFDYYENPVTLAQHSDILILTCPGGKETDNLVGKEVLEALGPQGYLVNMARGSVVNEPELIEALESKTIAGAALDVYANEPHVPPALRVLDNVVLSPHVGSATEETRIAMTRLAIENLRSFFTTGTLVTPVF
jgi:lactate dehydrogenase-like 2-hydroxyacid dehydrogenase